MECECHEWLYGVLGVVCGLVLAYVATLAAAAHWDDEEEEP